VVLGASLTAHGQSNATAQYQAYRLQHKSAADVENIVAQMLANTGTETHVVADPGANQILVRGPAKVQQIVRDLIATIDVPGESADGEREAKATVKAYTCEASRQDEAVAKLRGLYAARDDVRVAADPHAGRLLVLAPPGIHEQISRNLAAFRGSGDGTSAKTGRTARSEVLPTSLERFVPLARLPGERMETILRELLGPRLVPTGQPHQYRFVDASGRRVEVLFDRQGGGVRVAGATPVVGQFVRLIQYLDGDPDGEGRVVQALPVRNADPTKVREAVEAYRAGAAEAAPRRLAPQGPDDRGTRGHKQKPAEPDGNDQSRRYNHAGIELVSYLFQPGGGGAASGAGGAPAAGPAADTAGPKAPAKTAPGQPAEPEDRRDRLREFGPDVEIETLPDLDVIILRGRDRDVQELRRIIEEIERLSAETQPVIEIYPLKHVRGDALSLIVRQVEADLIAGRQGRVSITPLVKPNALLLIGWGEAVKAAKELIGKLDQPVAPETQQRVFRLKHASATTVAATVHEFFQGRTGLAPKVHASADSRTNSLVVEAAPRDLAEVELLLERLDTDSLETVLQTRIFKLQNTLANDVYATLQGAIDAARGGGTAGKSAALELLTVDPKGERILKSGILNDVRVTPDVRLNTLVVSAPAGSMDLLAALIRQLDSPGAVAQIKVFRIVNADANALIQMLRGLLPAQGRGAQLSAAEGESSIVPMRFSSDSRTNSIIAVGSPGDLKIVEALLLRLDTQDVQHRKTEVYRLKNSPANDVAVAVNDLLRSQRQLQTAIPGALSPFQQIESEVVIVPEPVSNSLIIYATPRFFEEILSLVEKLDAAPAQVMIQVLIADLSLRNTDEFGVELGLQDSVLFNRSLLENISTLTNTTQQSTSSGIITSTKQQIVSATNTPGYNFNSSSIGNSGSSSSLANASQTGGQGLSNFSLGRINNDLGYGGLVLSASSESVSMLIRALQESQRLEVLGRPQVMTLDNQPAFIQIGKRVPRITGTQVNQIGQANTIDLVNVGLILGVTPRISPEGMVVMEIDAEKSDVGPESEGIPVSISGSTVIRSPSFNTTMAQTTVSARDGETIVLGGLITRATTKVDRKVPFLGDVPVLGNLFKYALTQNKRTELLIILTPHVVRTPEEVERIKRIESSRMHWCLEDVQQVHGESGLTKSGGQVIYPDANPRGTTPGDSTMPKPASKPKSGKEEAPKPAPGLEAIPPSLPLPEPVPTPAPETSKVPGKSVPPEPSNKTPPAASQRPPPGGVVPAGYSSPAVSVAPAGHEEATNPGVMRPDRSPYIPESSEGPGGLRQGLPFSQIDYPKTPD